MRRNLFWLSDDQWGRIAPLLPTDVRGKDRAERSTSDQRHSSCAEERLPVVRLPAGVRPGDDNLQSLRPLGGARRVGTTVPRACRSWPIDRDADDRYHAHQGAPLGLGRKRGEQKQAIGRSRGGRNTKIHAIADAKGHLLPVLLSGGERAHRLSTRLAPHPSHQSGQEASQATRPPTARR